MCSSLSCCRVCSFIAGTKLMRPQIKCMESVAKICSCVSLNTCMITSKRFIFDLQTLGGSERQHYTNSTVFGSFIAAQMRRIIVGPWSIGVFIRFSVLEHT